MNPFRSLLHDARSLTRAPRDQARRRLGAWCNDTLAALGNAPAFEEDLGTQWHRILACSERTLRALPTAGAPRVLFGTVWGSHSVAHAVESMLALALRLRGATPFVISCGHALPACEWNPFGNFSPPPGRHGPPVTARTRLDRCRACATALARSHTLPGLEQVTLGSFLEPADRERAQRLAAQVPLAELRAYELDGVRVGEHAYASLLRATLRGTPLEDERTRVLAERYLASAILVRTAGERLLEAVRPEHFVAVHGVYVTQGTLCELARKLGIHVVVYGQPYRHGTLWLSHHDSYHRTLATGADPSWQGLVMTPERRGIAEAYLSEKHLVARDYADYHVGAVEDPELIRARLRLDSRPIVSAYTNIPWDAQIHYRSNLFSDMFSWLFATIRHFAARPEVQLVVRIHPAETFGAFPSAQPVAREIARAFPLMPENVTVALPDSRVSSYCLGRMSRAALVYGARMGVELVLLGVPVVVAGESFLRGKGFTFDPASSDEYFAILERVLELGPVTAVQAERAWRWYYHYFFRLMLPFPFYSADKDVGLSRPRLTFTNLAELAPGRSAVLDRICRGLVDPLTPFEWDAVES